LRVHGGGIVEEGPRAVRADAGVTINGLVRWLAGRGLAGLQAWAGTPGTVGGAICGNAHFQGRLISEHVLSVRLLAVTGEVIDVPAEAMAFAYDRSRIQRSGEIVLSVLFAVMPGAAPEDLRAEARNSLAFRKRTQPLHQSSAGCIFQNPDAGQELPEGVPRSAGALIDRAGLKGASRGGASVSSLHANFIVAAPGSRAADVRALVERCRDAVAHASGVRLDEEIVYLGAWDDSRESED
jgi:UDP-N-acetylmuramate dehydrogenase